MDDPEGLEPLEELERAERRRRIIVMVVAAALVIAAAAYLLLPRTVASGEIQGESWRLSIAPVGLGGSAVSLHGAEVVGVDPVGSRPTGALDETDVWHLGEGDDALTLIVGPTPERASSVRVSTEQLGVAGEARIHRIGWRRYHVDRLDGHVNVTELVGIDPQGRPLEVSRRSPSGD